MPTPPANSQRYTCQNLLTLLGLMLLLGACASPTSTLPPTPPPSSFEKVLWLMRAEPGLLVGLDPQVNQVVTGTTLAAASWAAVPLEESLWVTTGDAVHRLDVAGKTVVTSLPITDGYALDMAAQGDALWVAVSPSVSTVPQANIPSTARVVRIDPNTNTIVASIPLTVSHLESLAADNTGVWVTGMDVTEGAPTHFTLFQIDPSTNQLKTVILLDFLPLDMVAGAGQVWLSAADSKFGAVVMRFDPTTQAVTPIFVGGLPDRLALGAGALWVTERLGGRVFRVDPTTSTLVATVSLPGSSLGLATSAEGVWVVVYNGEARAVSRIDPKTNEVVATVAVNGLVVAVMGR